MGDDVMNQSISSSIPFLFPHKRLSYCVIIIILTISIFILIIIATNAIVIILVKLFLESLNLTVGKIKFQQWKKSQSTNLRNKFCHLKSTISQTENTTLYQEIFHLRSKHNFKNLPQKKSIFVRGKVQFCLMKNPYCQ